MLKFCSLNGINTYLRQSLAAWGAHLRLGRRHGEGVASGFPTPITPEGGETNKETEVVNYKKTMGRSCDD